MRLYFFNTLISSSWGIAKAVLPCTPSIVSAAIMALMIASSTAWAVASNRGVIRSLESVLAVVVFFLLNAFLFAVEKAKNISPDPFAHLPPTIPIPSGTRCTIRLSW